MIVTVKALLDSGATGLFADKKFVEKHGFKMQKLDRPVNIRNIDVFSFHHHKPPQTHGGGGKDPDGHHHAKWPDDPAVATNGCTKAEGDRGGRK